MSVRERLQQTNNGPTRSIAEDHSRDQFGSMTVTQKIENQKQVAYLLSCSCGATGQRVSQQELASGVVPVCRHCHGTGTALGDGARQHDAGTYEAPKPETRISARDRIEAAKRAAEIASIEKESGEVQQ